MKLKSSFSSVPYDEKAMAVAGEVRNRCETIESLLVSKLAPGRSLEYALKHLEDAHAWAGKAIRDDQVGREAALETA